MMMKIPPPLTWEECLQLVIRVETAAKEEKEFVTITREDAMNLCERLRTLLAYESINYFENKKKNTKENGSRSDK